MSVGMGNVDEKKRVEERTTTTTTTKRWTSRNISAIFFTKQHQTDILCLRLEISTPIFLSDKDSLFFFFTSLG